MIYHGVRTTPGGCLYRLGLALFDRDTPKHCLLRGDIWVFEPEASYERLDYIPSVGIPCGVTVGADDDTIHMHYAGADSCIALATSSVRLLLD